MSGRRWRSGKSAVLVGSVASSLTDPRASQRVSEPAALVDLATSAATVDGPSGSLGEVLDWVARRRSDAVTVERVRLDDLRGWQFDARRNLRHVSGRFFAVEGLAASVGDAGRGEAWSQVVLDQPEVGILGLLCQRREGVVEFLVQAKAEPGNVGEVQLSPTLQATWSNYRRLHGGRTPPYLEHFLSPQGRVLTDRPQPEQASRFLGKFNRNVVVQLPEDLAVPVGDQVRWCTLGQLRYLVGQPNLVNAEARSVLACLLSSGSEDEPDDPKEDGRLDDWLRAAGAAKALRVERRAVEDLGDWEVGAWEIAAPGRPFSVAGFRASIATREVTTWDQPLLQPATSGIVGLLTRRGEGGLEALVQARAEVGGQYPMAGPTVQSSDASRRAPYQHWFQPDSSGCELYRAAQSEEGGRFFEEQHLHVVVDVGAADVPAEDGYRWVTVAQLRSLIRRGLVNSQGRSVLACLWPA